jgi:hypothetical protein
VAVNNQPVHNNKAWIMKFSSDFHCGFSETFSLFTCFPNNIVVFKLDSRRSKLDIELKVTYVFRNEVSDSQDLINDGRNEGVCNSVPCLYFYFPCLGTLHVLNTIMWTCALGIEYQRRPRWKEFDETILFQS